MNLKGKRKSDDCQVERIDEIKGIKGKVFVRESRQL